MTKYKFGNLKSWVAFAVGFSITVTLFAIAWLGFYLFK